MRWFDLGFFDIHSRETFRFFLPFALILRLCVLLSGGNLQWRRLFHSCAARATTLSRGRRHLSHGGGLCGSFQGGHIESDLHVVCRHVPRAPLTTGFRRLCRRCPTKCDGRLVGRLNEGRRVCDIQRVRLCGSRVAHAFFEPASRCSIAALLATLLVLIANTRACGSVQPLRSCHAAELPVVQPMGERHNTSRLSVSARRWILLSLGA